MRSKKCSYGHGANRGAQGQCLECQRLRTQRWREANREEDRRRKRAYRKANPHMKAAENRRWLARNPDIKRQYRRNRKALEKNALGQHTANDIAEIFKAQRGRCAYCREKVGDRYHVDHILALKRGGSNDRANLQITCIPCNQRKRAHHPLDFARSCGMLL